MLSNKRHSMKMVMAGKRCMMLNEDGSLNYPFSLFLADNFDNANTRELVAQSLRVFERFLRAYDIELENRAVNGKSMSQQECAQLSSVVWRPLPELELMSDSMIRRISSASSELEPKDKPKAVEPNTAKKRLDHIAQYLHWYRVTLLDEAILSAATRNDLCQSYDAAKDRLMREIRGTPQNHPYQIRSLPSKTFKEIIKALVVCPEKLFANESGKPSATMLRDRAMALLACEGLRPGAIANITMMDFKHYSGASKSYVSIADNVKKRAHPITSGTPHQKGMTSTSVSYASKTTIELWPFTRDAILRYISEERAAVLGRRMRNRSNSFLFLNNSDGGPIGHRSTLTAVFKRLGIRLTKLGLLDRSNDPHATGKAYEFYAYVLRHSSASFFLESNLCDSTAEDKMRTRYGWSQRSQMPHAYGNRALIDTANTNMMDFHQLMLNEMQVKEDT